MTLFFFAGAFSLTVWAVAEFFSEPVAIAIVTCTLLIGQIRLERALKKTAKDVEDIKWDNR